MTSITFLGSGCWQGIPGQFCDDKISKDVEWGSKDFRFRTSLLITTNKNNTIVVEVTPDIRLQAWKYKLQPPNFFLISHWHWDHLFGFKDLDWFCEKNNPLVYGSQTTKDWVEKDMSYIPIQFKMIQPFEKITLDELTITAFPVNHTEGAYGFLFEANNKRIAYFGDMNGLPEESKQIMTNLDVAIVDASFSEGGIDDDDTHLIGEELQLFIKELNAKETILTHIASFHEQDHNALQEKYSPHIIAYDGLIKEF